MKLDLSRSGGKAGFDNGCGGRTGTVRVHVRTYQVGIKGEESNESWWHFCDL
jgi:hypothetical protein